MNNWAEGLTPEERAVMGADNREQYTLLLAEAMSAAEAGGAGGAAGAGPVEPPVLGIYGGRKPIYVYMGHATDLLIPDPEHPGSYKPDKTRNVPEGCTYSTISETGFTTRLDSIFTIDTLFNKPVDRLLFYEPALSIANIHTRLKRINPRIEFHVTNSPKPYTNSLCTFLLQFEEEDGSIHVYKSGIYDMSLPNPPRLTEGLDDAIIIPHDGFTFDHIRRIYEGSIFPTADDIISEILSPYSITVNSPDFKYVKDNKFSLSAVQRRIRSLLEKKGYRTQEDIFRILPPGNHYNIACRSFYDGMQVNEGVLAGARGISRRALEELGGQQLQHAEADRLKNIERAEADRLKNRKKQEKRILAATVEPACMPGILRFVTGIDNGTPDLKLRDRLIPEFRIIKEKMDQNGLLLNDLNEPLQTYIRKVHSTGIATNIRGGKRTKKKRVSKKKSRKRF